MKKILSLMLVCLVAFGIASCSNAEDKQNEVIEQQPIVVVITDVGGIGDHSFNDATLSALEEVAEDEDVAIRCFEAASPEDYDGLIKEAVNEDAVLTIAVGSNMKSSIENAAKANPKSNFGIIDGDIEADNVYCINFADNESGFLAGYAAAKTSKTGVIGFVGGEERETVDLFRYGYIAGAKSANANIEVKTAYVGTFYDREKGKQTAEKLFNEQNADVVMHVAGASGLGVIDAAKENGFWAIGADKDQSHLASKSVLASAVKNIEPGLDDMVKMAVKDKFKGENKIYNTKDEGVSLSDSAGNITGDLKDMLDDIKAAIKKGKIEVPRDASSLENFEFPEEL